MEKKQTVFIRADGNFSMGLGHLVRSIALAQMLKPDFEISFFCRFLTEKIKETFKFNDFHLNQIGEDDDLIPYLSGHEIVVLDGYHFDSGYQRKIKESGVKLVCIDDLHDKYFYADLIINSTPGISPNQYKTEPYTEFALGNKYTLLRPAFLNQGIVKEGSAEIGTVLICFGGSDKNNLTLSTLKVVLGFKEFKKIIIITGEAFIGFELLKDQMEKDQRIMYYNSINDVQMHALMLESDIAIVPSSGILLEALASDCRVISGFYIENQKYLYQYYKSAGAFIDSIDFNAETIYNAINLSFQGKNLNLKLIDGNSGKRLLKIFNQLKSSSEMTIRDAVFQDCELTFTWAIDEKIRAFSFQNNKINWEEHSNWFLNKIMDGSCQYYIIEKKYKPIGSIRFDIQNNEAVISYLMDSKFHGNGLGKELLKMGLTRFIGMYGKYGIKKIIGYVKIENLPSAKIFERLGFERSAETEKIKFEKNY